MSDKEDLPNTNHVSRGHLQSITCRSNVVKLVEAGKGVAKS